MSVYNGDKFLSSSIESILHQTYSDFELLILDDGSTDNTSKILNNYQNHQKIRLFKNNENIGLTKSLNLLINKSKGSYIARQDCDDLSDTKRLEKQLSFLLKHDLDACTTRAINKQSNRLTPRFSYFLPYKISVKFKNPFIHGTLLVKSEILKKIMYDERLYYAQDFLLFLQILKSYKIKTINEGLYILNTRDNISEKYKIEQKKFFKLARNFYNEI